MEHTRRLEVFDELARAVLLDPDAQAMGCQSGKIAMNALLSAPEKIALMFYCDVAHQDGLKPVVQKHAAVLRQKGLREGWLTPRDGFLQRWWFKTDAQTRHELQQGRHVAQLEYQDRLVQAMLEFSKADGPKKPRAPR